MNEFFISDTHYGHSNILKFKGLDGALIRSNFSSVEEMDQFMIDSHNKVVGPNDILYHGGDVCWTNQDLHRVMPQLNGKKILILGNHDKLRMSEYLRYFSDIYGSKWFGHTPIKFMLTHIPMHSFSQFPSQTINVHGHIHEKEILITKTTSARWYNISVERLNYTPIPLEQLLIELNKIQ